MGDPHGFKDVVLIKAVAMVRERGGNTNLAAADLGCTPRSVQRRLKEARARGFYGQTTAAPLGATLETVDALLDRRIAAHERQTVPGEVALEVPDDLPIGVLHFSDTHLDDDGTDLALIREHVRILRETPGMYGGCIGDIVNNWGPKHAILWSQQSSTAEDAWRLVEWFLGGSQWAYIVLGNHDCFAGPGSGALAYIMRQTDVAADALHEVRVKVAWPDGQAIRVQARHSWPGNSMWNAVHGMVRGARLDNPDPADIMLGGHTHKFGAAQVETGGRVVTLLQLSTYKRNDDFARRCGYRESLYGCAAVTVLDPRGTGPDRVRVLWDVAEGADYLGWLRARRGA